MVSRLWTTREICTDSSGARMSQKYLDFFDFHGVKLILVPKEAHRRMGSVERPRLHAVRSQLLKMLKEEPNLRLEDAVRVACYQRNRLTSIAGSSPYQIVIGHTTVFWMVLPIFGQMPLSTEDQALRCLAAKAFLEANASQVLKRASTSC